MRTLTIVFLLSGILIYSQDAKRNHASIATPQNAAAKIIAEWTFSSKDTSRSIIAVREDGVVTMSGDLVAGRGPLHEGRLSAEELGRFKKVLSRIAHGLEGSTIKYLSDAGAKAPTHKMTIRLPGSAPTVLETSVRYIELESARGLVVIGSSETFTHLDRDGRTRSQLLPIVLAPADLAVRLVWVELEAEMLRAVAQSLLADPPIAAPPDAPRPE